VDDATAPPDGGPADAARDDGSDGVAGGGTCTWCARDYVCTTGSGESADLKLSAQTATGCSGTLATLPARVECAGPRVCTPECVTATPDGAALTWPMSGKLVRCTPIRD
jgi:hypothetical protein